MSNFPNPSSYKRKKSEQYFKHFYQQDNSLPFVLKKSKGVYLYDIDDNKYVDFSLQRGEVIISYSPSRFTKFMKNALSSGLSSIYGYNKFIDKALQYWKKKLESPYISFFDNILDIILLNLNTPHKPIVGYTTEYLYNLLKPLENIVHLQRATPDIIFDLLIYEAASDDGTIFSPDTIQAHKKIGFHSRFLRLGLNKCLCFNTDHIIFSAPFGGRALAIYASKTNYSEMKFHSFDNAILFLESAKTFYIPEIRPFYHELLEYHTGFAVTKQNLDLEFFYSRGIVIYNNILFFSPEHSEHDYKRLRQALNEYQKLHK